MKINDLIIVLKFKCYHLFDVLETMEKGIFYLINGMIMHVHGKLSEESRQKRIGGSLPLSRKS